MSGMASLSALLLWFGTTPLPAEPTGLSASISGRGTSVVVGDNNGGAVLSFAHRVLDLYRSDANVRIEGDCSSSCSLILALPEERICVGINGQVRIHQASFPGGLKDRRLTRMMWNVYPDWVRDKVGDPDRMDADLIDISRDELVKHYGPCIE